MTLSSRDREKLYDAEAAKARGKLWRCLLELYVDGEQMAINGKTEWDGNRWRFSDNTWKSDNSFTMFRRARKVLNLEPISYTGKNPPPHNYAYRKRHIA